ncbi:hypothetical protein [Pseudomonas sp. Irchel s3b2]|uniref:hypothetical protein n=1 Tax=Pseudomonas sp. Irchel s3b2 TaxID=2009073 RepID=UPI000BA48A81|nr:hypothetical protein [Pseudomonas sp. Irchel s3b2]
MSDLIAEYENALNRLIEGQPTRVPAGTKITKNSVALEAGRGKGSIRKDRECFDGLNVKIDAGAKKQKQQLITFTPKNIDVASNKNDKVLYQQSLARELMLIRQIDNLERNLSEIGNVKPFKPKLS